MSRELTNAFCDWMRAVYENTGQCPREVYVDMRTHSALFLEVAGEAERLGVAREQCRSSGLAINGVRIRAIDTE